MAEFTGMSQQHRRTPQTDPSHRSRTAPDRLSPLIASRQTER